jgi:small-conductance mechanosensitive channel
MLDTPALDEVLAQGLTLGDWLLALAILVGALIGGRVARAVLARRFKNQGDTAGYAAAIVGNVVTWAAGLAGIVYALGILGVRLAPLLGAIGIGGIALALATQSILANFIASILIQTRRPFRRGDQIGSNGFEGVVEGVNLRAVAINTFDGERVLIPAADVLGAPITNFTVLGARRTTLQLGVGYGTDLEQAQSVILDAVNSVEAVLDDPAPEAVVELFNESSIDFAIRFWNHPQRAFLWHVRSEVAMAVKRALDEAGIEIPFPQRVMIAGPPAPTAVKPGRSAKGRRS